MTTRKGKLVENWE